MTLGGFYERELGDWREGKGLCCIWLDAVGDREHGPRLRVRLLRRGSRRRASCWERQRKRRRPAFTASIRCSPIKARSLVPARRMLVARWSDPNLTPWQTVCFGSRAGLFWAPPTTWSAWCRLPPPRSEARLTLLRQACRTRFLRTS